MTTALVDARVVWVTLATALDAGVAVVGLLITGTLFVTVTLLPVGAAAVVVKCSQQLIHQSSVLPAKAMKYITVHKIQLRACSTAFCFETFQKGGLPIL